MKFSVVVGIAAIASLVSAQQASAVVYTIAYYGTVSSGSLNLGALFGGVNLDGRGVVATYNVDTSLGTYTENGAPGTFSYSSDVTGGSNFGTASPIVSSNLSINGSAFTLSSMRRGIVFENNSVFEETRLRHYTLGSNNDELSTRVSSPFNFVDGNVQTAPTNLTISGRTGSLGEFTFRGANGLLTRGEFRASSYVVTVAGAAVPEPATWALMILGFGGVGAALRRRRLPVAA